MRYMIKEEKEANLLTGSYEKLKRSLCILALFGLIKPGKALQAGTEDAPYSVENGVLVISDGVQSLEFISGEFEPFRQVVFPDSLKELETESICMASVTQLTFPEGLERVMDSSIVYCPLLWSVSFPSTLREFSAGAFYNCDALSQVMIAPENPFYKSDDGAVFSKDGSVLVFYPPGKSHTHYDVPAGTRYIAPYAFGGNHYLQTVSLPMGLEQIGRGAFSQCGMLTSVALPLSLELIEDYAFDSCVHLSSIAVPSHTAVGRDAFFNCPVLGTGAAYPVVDEGGQEDRLYWRPAVYGVMNPENVQDLLAVFASPDDAGAVVGRFPSGAQFEIMGQEGAFYRVCGCGESGLEGYAAITDIMLITPLQGLFEIASAVPRKKTVPLYSDPCAASQDGRMTKGQFFDCTGFEGQWLEGKVLLAGEDDSSYRYAYIGDFSLTRAHTGDNRTYGIVCGSAPGNRVNLREKPRKSASVLGKYFTGVQVEILSENKGWYSVSVGGRNGYMMKEYVAIVPQADAKEAQAQ